jgi:AcrR family transcriptional regulator
MSSSPPNTPELLAAAFDVFRTEGYNGATLEQIAERAKTDLTTMQARFVDKHHVLTALLAAHSPLSDIEAALTDVKGEAADEIIREAMRRAVAAIQKNQSFLELAALDVQANNGAFLGSLSTKLLPKGLSLLERIKATGQLRPVADVILARTLVSLLMGYILSEQAMPQVARVVMRLFPQKAWLDGMVDLLLYGVLEDDAR